MMYEFDAANMWYGLVQLMWESNCGIYEIICNL